jgi:hypothetical protein
MSATRRRRRVRITLLSLCLALIGAVVAGVPVYVRPQIDSLRHADAILILGGPDYERYRYGLDLVRRAGRRTWWCRIRTGQMTDG